MHPCPQSVLEKLPHEHNLAENVCILWALWRNRVNTKWLMEKTGGVEAGQGHWDVKTPSPLWWGPAASLTQPVSPVASPGSLTHARFPDSSSPAQKSQSGLHHSDPSLSEWPDWWSAHFAEGLGFSILWPWASSSSRNQGQLGPSKSVFFGSSHPSSFFSVWFHVPVVYARLLCWRKAYERREKRERRRQAARQTDSQTFHCLHKWRLWPLSPDMGTSTRDTKKQIPETLSPGRCGWGPLSDLVQLAYSEPY